MVTLWNLSKQDTPPLPGAKDRFHRLLATTRSLTGCGVERRCNGESPPQAVLPFVLQWAFILDQSLLQLGRHRATWTLFEDGQ